MPKFNLHTAIFVIVVVCVTIKFRAQIAAALVKVPVLGPLVAG